MSRQKETPSPFIPARIGRALSSIGTSRRPGRFSAFGGCDLPDSFADHTGNISGPLKQLFARRFQERFTKTSFFRLTEKLFKCGFVS